jgi:hypothetical protein
MQRVLSTHNRGIIMQTVWTVKKQAMLPPQPNFDGAVEEATKRGFFTTNRKTSACPECGQKRISFIACTGTVLVEACLCGLRQISVRRPVTK